MANQYSEMGVLFIYYLSINYALLILTTYSGMPSIRMRVMKMLGNGCTTASKPVMLAKLFRGQDNLNHPLWPLPVEVNAKLELMQELAEVDEDKCTDDGAVEIISEDK